MNRETTLSASALAEFTAARLRNPDFPTKAAMLQSLSERFVDLVGEGKLPVYFQAYQESLTSDLDPQGRASMLIKTCALNRSYKQTLSERHAIPRYSVVDPDDAIAYGRFEALVYDPACALAVLLEAYHSLPTPRPLHIQGPLFEAFMARVLCVPMRIAAPVMAPILLLARELKECQFPLSLPEQNKLLGFQFLGPASNPVLLKTYRKLIAGMEAQGYRDISTFDTILKGVFPKQSRPFQGAGQPHRVFEAIVRDLRTLEVEPLRTTIQTCMALITALDERNTAMAPEATPWSEGKVFLALAAVHTQHFVTDTKFLGVLVAGLVRFGYVEEAEAIVVACRDRVSPPGLIRAETLDHRIADTMVSELSLDPPGYGVSLNDEVYRPLIGHYCATDSFSNVMETISIMNEQRVLLSTATLSVVYRGFITHNATLDEPESPLLWTLTHLNAFTRFVLEVYDSQAVELRGRFAHYYQTSSVVFTSGMCDTILDCYLIVLGQQGAQYHDDMAQLQRLKQEFTQRVRTAMVAEEQFAVGRMKGQFRAVSELVRGDLMRDVMKELVELGSPLPRQERSQGGFPL